MAATFLQKCVLCAGFMSLFHAAFSAAQHRTHLRITEQEFDSLPMDILVQGIVSLFVTMYGVMCIAGDFKEIRATVDLESRSWETLRNIPSFYIFSHRGKAFSPEYSAHTEINNYSNQKFGYEENDI
ncbi:ER membrane protein complex subunit 5 [Ischnura elegans]|uniref:ER membrane protein complex subunit 5 n=1 Tax=Ischnura elegans TaxID=197161 RepID=UPI001ED8B237|nr:ER membrane protein complex subunit 5 [Ischnura elegans]